jgi:putative membrane protein
MSEDSIIRTASFNPRVCTYWLLSTTLVLCLTVIGIPFLLIWLPVGLFLTKRYLSRMECILTEKDLKVNKGIFVRVEKTIPLEKITDLGMVQGPIMRHFGIHQLTVETAGQSAQGPLVSLTGIVDAKGFREAVLSQRDAMRGGGQPVQSEPGKAPQAIDQTQLAQMNETLLRIEELLKAQSDR